MNVVQQVMDWVEKWFLRKIGDQTFTGDLTVTGNVGIGATPSWPLSIVKEIDNSSDWFNGAHIEIHNPREAGDDSGAVIAFLAERATGGVGRAAIVYMYPGATAGEMHFSLDADANTKQMTILESGKVGIGGTPLQKLHVIGTGSANNPTVLIDHTGWFGAKNSSGTQGRLVGVSSDVLYMGDVDGISTSVRIRGPGGTNDIWIDSSGNVGIGGTPDTNVLLDLVADKRMRVQGYGSNPSAGTGLELGYYSTGGYATIKAADRTGGTTKGIRINDTAIVVDASGNVGIGVAPSYALHVAGEYIVQTRAGQANFRVANSSADKSIQIAAEATNLTIQAANAAQTGGVTNLVLNPSGGNVGIGVTPSYALDINGDLMVRGTDIYLGTGGPNFGADSNSIYYNADANHYFTVGGTYKANLDANGLSINNSTTGPGTGVGLLVGSGEVRIKGAEATDAILGLWADKGDDNGDLWRFRAAQATTTGYLYLESYSAGSWQQVAMFQDASGTSGAQLNGAYDQTTASAANVYVASPGTLNRSTSSIKYKTNIRPFPDKLGLKLVKNLNPVVFWSTCEVDPKDVDYVGFVAEEVDALGAKPFVFYGPNGEPEGVQYDRITTALVSAVQELERRVTALEARLP